MIVEAVEQAEGGNDVIVRLYESAHTETRAAVRLGFTVQAAAEVNLMEGEPQPLEVVDGSVELELRPFEIKTLRLTLP